LIALMIRKRGTELSQKQKIALLLHNNSKVALRSEKTSFASNTSGSPAVKPGPRLRCSSGEIGNGVTVCMRSLSCPFPHCFTPVRPDVFPLHDVR